MSFSERLDEHERPGIDDITGGFRKGFRKPFDAMEGRIIADEDAPDPYDYPDTGEGRREYLRDVHAWTVEQLQDAVATAQHTVADVVDETPEDPSPGTFDGFERDETQAFDTGIIELVDATEELVEARKRVEAVEEAMRDA